MEMKFDPMTGQPIQPQVQQPTMGFDPMTGQPIQPQGTITGYDPMTGQPIYANAGATFTAAGAKTGLGIGAKIGIAVAAVAVVACGTVTAFASGVFLPTSAKVAAASARTFTDAPAIVQDMNFTSVVASKEYTLGGEVSYEGQKVSGEVRYAEKKQQIAAFADVAGASEISAYVTLDSDSLSFAAPDILDDTLVYYYTKKNDGAIVDLIGDDNIEQINELLKTASSGKKTSEEAEKYAKAIMDEYKSLKYKKISAESFEVDGKSRKCKGFSTEITSDNINNILDAYMEYIEDTIPEELLKEMNWREVEEEMSYLQRQIDRMDDLEIEFFLYKNKLACIRTEVEGEDLELQFHGGAYRMQNMELLVDDKTMVEMTGEKSGSTENLKLKAMGETLVKVEYDTKSGDFEIKIEDLGSAKGNIEKNRKGVTVSVNKIFGYDGLKLKVYALDGAKFEAIDEKHIFDVGNADESDFRDLISDIDMDTLEDYADAVDDIF